MPIHTAFDIYALVDISPTPFRGMPDSSGLQSRRVTECEGLASKWQTAPRFEGPFC